MSTPSQFNGRAARQFPTIPKGVTVASFETYPEAQAAVDKLAKAEFPVRELSIVGTDLTSVERITGKLTWGRVAGAGALSGAWFGTFLGLLFLIFSPAVAGLGLLLSAVLIGAGFGMVFGLVSYSVNRRRRDFTSVMQVIATRYAIIADPAHVDRARNVLGVTAAGAAPAPTPQPQGWTPAAGAPAAPVAPAQAPAPAPASPTDVPQQPDAPVSTDAPATTSGADAEVQSDAPAGTPAPMTYGEAQDAARRARAEAEAADRRRRVEAARAAREEAEAAEPESDRG